MYQAIQNQLGFVDALQFATAGLSLPVLANRARSCSTRSTTMNLARSIALRATQEPTIPATHEIFELRTIARAAHNTTTGRAVTCQVRGVKKNRAQGADFPEFDLPSRYLSGF